MAVVSTRCAAFTSVLALMVSSAVVAGATGYDWHLPAGFPTPLVPPENPMSVAKVELGRRLFCDKRLSLKNDYSCASCHRSELAYTDGRARAVGSTGEPLRRAAPSLANLAYAPAYTWADPHVLSLEAQMRRPLFDTHPVELGVAGREALVVAELSADATYRVSFARAFDGAAAPLTMDHVIKAIAAFERTLISGRAPFDRYVFDDARDALSPAAKRGMELFYSPGIGCAGCHFGLNFSGPLVYEGHPRAKAIYANTGLYDVDGRGGYPANDRGLIELTHHALDMGRFRVPTLRNIALTAPYMHDGSKATLEAVLDHYAAGSSGGDARLHSFELSADMKHDLIEFLRSLTDPGFVRPGCVHAP